MKVVVSSSGADKTSMLDPRFGRCSYFIFVDTETDTVDAVVNEAVSSGHGAGIQAAQSVIEAGAEAVISRRVGPNAFQVLAAAGLTIYESDAASVEEAVVALKAGELTAVNAPTGSSHAGMGGRY
ncbi:MAG: NifB/NifX family molybdenum-iron cluster-binding protein [Anaerolineae bacterium]|nr:NifB/NifX family molybdenum-iron cluster-binding protein [Anaerolineae bacterium]